MIFVCLWRSGEERVHESESDSVVVSVGGCLRNVMERGKGVTGYRNSRLKLLYADGGKK
jgi:hypothetical protein